MTVTHVPPPAANEIAAEPCLWAAAIHYGGESGVSREGGADHTPRRVIDHEGLDCEVEKAGAKHGAKDNVEPTVAVTIEARERG
jgi:hypothetical protein